MSVLYTRFYAVLLLVVILVQQLVVEAKDIPGKQLWITLLVLLAFSFWVPQVCHSANSNTRIPFDSKFVVLNR
jgi:hypothetical protein